MAGATIAVPHACVGRLHTSSKHVLAHMVAASRHQRLLANCTCRAAASAATQCTRAGPRRRAPGRLWAGCSTAWRAGSARCRRAATPPPGCRWRYAAQFAAAYHRQLLSHRETSLPCYTGRLVGVTKLCFWVHTMRTTLCWVLRHS